MTEATSGRSSGSFASVSTSEAMVTKSRTGLFAVAGFFSESSPQTCLKRLTKVSMTCFGVASGGKLYVSGKR